MTRPRPDLERLLADLDQLATFSEPDTPGCTRRFPSAAYRAGRDWLQQRFADAGLAPAIDAAGNLVGRRAGRLPLPPILIGSHSDTVYGGGRFDGALGVLAALEVVRALDDAGIALDHPVWVVDFLAEEANDFGVSCVGSRGLTAGLPAEWLAARAHGGDVAAALRAMGGDPGALAAPLLAPGALHAALEVHIEQGPVLEAGGMRLGAVSGIVAIRRATLTLRGRPDHAGTAPMALRHDALAAAAECVLAAEQAARDEPGSVATVGRLTVAPNQSNVVPGHVELFLEVRSLDADQIERIWQRVMAQTRAAAAQRGVSLGIGTQTEAAATRPPAWLLELVEDACRAVDPATQRLVSGAGHDMMHLAQVTAAAMIFVPCRDGRSHCPDEDATPEDCERGARALLEAVLRLDARGVPS